MSSPFGRSLLADGELSSPACLFKDYEQQGEEGGL